jgi:hypothetical protein
MTEIIDINGVEIEVDFDYEPASSGLVDCEGAKIDPDLPAHYEINSAYIYETGEDAFLDPEITEKVIEDALEEKRKDF